MAKKIPTSFMDDPLLPSSGNDNKEERKDSLAKNFSRCVTTVHDGLEAILKSYLKF